MNGTAPIPFETVALTCPITQSLGQLASLGGVLGGLHANNEGAFTCSSERRGFQTANLLHAPILESTNPISSLLEQAKNGLSVMVLITPPKEAQIEAPILTFGRRGGSETASNDKGCPGFDFQLAQTQRLLEVSFTTDQGCQRHLVTNVMLSPNPTQIVVSMGERQVTGQEHLFCKIYANAS